MLRLNEQFHGVIWPVILGFVVCDVLGFLGNITVCYVFSCRYEKNCFRFLVLALGIVDLVSCCTTVPIEIISTWLWFDAPSSSLCKAKNFLVQFTGLTAMYMLFVMSLYKFRRICKPFSKQLNQKIITILCVIGIFNSLLFSTPTLHFWGVNNRTVPIDNSSFEEVFICEVHRAFLETPYPRMYNHLLSVYNIFLVTTIVLYVFIARTTILHVRDMRKLFKEHANAVISISVTNKSQHINSSDIKESASVSEETVSTSAVNIEISESMGENGEKRNIQTATGETQFEVKEENDNNSRFKANKTSPYPQYQTQAIPVQKVTIMAILSGTFAVTFLLAQVFGYSFAIRGFSDYSSLSELRLFFFWYRLYFINYCLNPFVYFALDRQFRREVINILRCSCDG